MPVVACNAHRIERSVRQWFYFFSMFLHGKAVQRFVLLPPSGTFIVYSYRSCRSYQDEIWVFCRSSGMICVLFDTKLIMSTCTAMSTLFARCNTTRDDKGSIASRADIKEQPLLRACHSLYLYRLERPLLAIQPGASPFQSVRNTVVVGDCPMRVETTFGVGVVAYSTRLS